MKVIALFLFAIFCGSALGAVGTVFTIDDFIIDSPAIVIVIQTQNFPITSANFVSDSTILGGERDLELTATNGGNNLVLSAGVSGGTFNSAAPKGANGVSLLQYDGVDGSTNLNPSGLFSYYYNDFTFDNGFALRTNISADISTNVFFRVYSGNANSFCEYLQPIPGNGKSALYTLNYSNFNRTGGGCNFSNVGAFEIEVDLSQNVDISIDIIEVVANLASPSRTPSRTPSKRPASPSHSRTPTPSKIPASHSRTRTPTRTPVAASASRTRTPTPSRIPASHSRTRTPTRTPVAASHSRTRTPTSTPVAASHSRTRTPTRTPVAASHSRTRTPTRSPVAASHSRTRTPTRTPVPASHSRTRTPTRTPVPASHSRTRTPTRSPSHVPKSPSRTPSPSSCICTCPELECYMFQYGTFTFNGHRAGRDVDIIDEFAAVDQQEVVNDEGFDFLKFF